MLAQAPPPVIQGESIRHNPVTLQAQDTMSKPPEVVSSRFGPEAFKGFHESKSAEIIKKQALMYWAKANDLNEPELDQAIRQGKMDCYQAADKAVKYLRSKDANLSY